VPGRAESDGARNLARRGDAPLEGTLWAGGVPSRVGAGEHALRPRLWITSRWRPASRKSLCWTISSHTCRKAALGPTALDAMRLCPTRMTWSCGTPRPRATRCGCLACRNVSGASAHGAPGLFAGAGCIPVVGHAFPGDYRKLAESGAADHGFLSDPRNVEFILVTIPEALGVYQSRRVIHDLSAHGLGVRHMIINNLVVNADCEFHRQRMEMQRPYLELLKNEYSGQMTLTPLPLFAARGTGRRTSETGRENPIRQSSIELPSNTCAVCEAFNHKTL